MSFKLILAVFSLALCFHSASLWAAPKIGDFVGTWEGRCRNVRSIEKSFKPRTKISLGENGGTLEIEEAEIWFSVFGCQGNEEAATVEPIKTKYNKLDGEKKVALYESITEDDSGKYRANRFIENLEGLRFEVEILSQPPGRKLNRRGYAVLSLTNKEGVTHLAQVELLIHPENNEEQRRKWSGKSIIDDLATDKEAEDYVFNFERIALNSLSKKTK